MSWLQLLILALVQGLTEFLPISSSAHLILASDVAGWPDQGLAFDLAVHLGTLVAVLVYFSRELKLMFGAVITRRPADAPYRSLAGWLILASVPLGVAGLLLGGWIEIHLRGARVIAWATIVFALLLGLAWLLRRTRVDESRLGARRALLIGLAQVLALIPGTSRAGITMTAGLLLGLGPRASARFSFLLAIPAILMAGGYGAWQVASGNAPIDWVAFLAAAGVSAIAALLCIHVFLRLVERIGMLPFVFYRLALGIALLAWLA